MKELERIVLGKAREKKSAGEIAALAGVALSSVMSVLESLKENGFASVETKSSLAFGLTHDGVNALAKGLPERKLVSSLHAHKPLSVGQLKEALTLKKPVEGGLSEQEFGIALQWAKAFGLI